MIGWKRFLIFPRQTTNTAKDKDKAQTSPDMKTSACYDTHARPHLAAGIHSGKMLGSQSCSHTWSPEEFFGRGQEGNTIQYQI